MGERERGVELETVVTKDDKTDDGSEGMEGFFLLIMLKNTRKA